MTNPQPYAAGGQLVPGKNHNGSYTSELDVFFGDPGGQIGQVLSGSTNAQRDPQTGQVKQRNGGRVFFAILGAGGGALVGWGAAAFLVAKIASEPIAAANWFAIIFFGIIGAVLTWIIAEPADICTYVGTDGVARFKRKKGNITAEILRFADAAAMTAGKTRQYVNGVYSGTSYNFAFKDRGGSQLFTVIGQFQQKEYQQAPASDGVHFGHACEDSWTYWRFNQLMDEIATTGIAKFQTGGGNWVGLAPGMMELHFNGKHEKLEKQDIADLFLQNGFLTIERKGAKKGWFTKDGVFQFSCAQMSDFRAFIIMLDKTLGYRFG